MKNSQSIQPEIEKCAKNYAGHGIAPAEAAIDQDDNHPDKESEQCILAHFSQPWNTSL